MAALFFCSNRAYSDSPAMKSDDQFLINLPPAKASQGLQPPTNILSTAWRTVFVETWAEQKPDALIII